MYNATAAASVNRLFNYDTYSCLRLQGPRWTTGLNPASVAAKGCKRTKPVFVSYIAYKMPVNADQDFSTIPWCQTYLNDPDYVQTAGIMRNSTDNTYDTMISKTLKTNNTIPAIVCLKKRLKAEEESFETLTFMSLGTDMNGHVDTAHGGAIATILDEVAGFVVREWCHTIGDSQATYVTGNLNISFLKPLRTPQIILIKGSTMLAANEAKIKVVVHLHDKSQVIAIGEAMFIKLRREAL